jgi:serine/threonine-protein kinase
VELTQGLVIAQRFRLVRELGRGGMGSVWLAHHTSLDTPCAVKFINPEAMSLPEIRQRFEREAKAAASLRSVNVVQIIDYGHSEVGPYIAMEHLEGEDLAARLVRRGRLSPPETVEIVANVARALAKAHAAGLVHRDLKPENVFLVRDEDREIVKVLDFGIAKANRLAGNDGATKTGSLLGTPSYMSPEQAQGTKTVDHRSDLWSLAVLAFRCLTGRLPFVSEALGDLLVQIIVAPMPVPSHFAPDLSPMFDAWWARAAARDPAQRFQSAREAADALAATFGLAQAGPPSWEASSASGAHPYAGYPTPAGSPSGWGPASAGMAARSATPSGAQPPYPSGPSAGGGQPAYPSGPSAGGGSAAHAAGPSGSVQAQSGSYGAAPVPGSGGSWGGAGAAGAGPTALGVAHTMAGAPPPARGGSKPAIAIGAVLLVAGIGAAVGFMRRGGAPEAASSTAAAAPPPTASASAASADPTPAPSASAAAPPGGSASASPTPADSAAPPATSASASAQAAAPTARPPLGGAKPAPSGAPARRGRLVIPGSNGKDPAFGF